MKLSKKITSVAILSGLIITLGLTTMAQAANPVTNIQGGLAAAGGGVYDPNVKLETVVAGIISSVLALVGVALLGFLLYGGFLWMTAAGEDGKVKKARGVITDAIVGLVIIVLAYYIADYVLARLLEATTGAGAGGE